MNLLQKAQKFFTRKGVIAVNKELDQYFDELNQALKSVDKKSVEIFIEALKTSLENNKQIITMGNGGSATTAAHTVNELCKGLSYGKEKRFRAICLTDNVPTITAYSNDIGYESIFIEQLKNILNEGDLVIAFSGSGNSKNVVDAIKYANEKGAVTVGFCGFDGGELKRISKVSVWANIGDMRKSEDVHLILVHACGALIEKQN
jgi:D-sedoheptulose 7-phosphate isomerase